MLKKPLEAIEEHFNKVTDPRMDRTKEHNLIDIIAIAIYSVIRGAEGWTDIENFGNSKLPNGIPSYDTFGLVFSMVDTQQFQLAFYTAPAVRCRCEWVLAVNEMVVQGQIINIDRKRLAGLEDKLLGKRAIYMVSTWAEENEIALGQRKVDKSRTKSPLFPNYSRFWLWRAVP